MSRNLNRSKASYKKRCFWYKNKKDLNKIVADEVVQGLFYAKILSSNINPYINNETRGLMIDIVLETPDNAGLLIDNFVKMDGEMYRVISVDNIPLGNQRFNYTIRIQRRVSQ